MVISSVNERVEKLLSENSCDIFDNLPPHILIEEYYKTIDCIDFYYRVRDLSQISINKIYLEIVKHAICTKPCCNLGFKKLLYSKHLESRLLWLPCTTITSLRNIKE